MLYAFDYPEPVAYKRGGANCPDPDISKRRLSEARAVLRASFLFKPNFALAGM